MESQESGSKGPLSLFAALRRFVSCEAAKSAVAGVFTSALGDLKPMLDKVLAIPGVSSIIKPAIDALLEKLSGFKA